MLSYISEETKVASRRRRLADEALNLDPFCAGAYGILATVSYAIERSTECPKDPKTLSEMLDPALHSEKKYHEAIGIVNRGISKAASCDKDWKEAIENAEKRIPAS